VAIKNCNKKVYLVCFLVLAYFGHKKKHISCQILSFTVIISVMSRGGATVYSVGVAVPTKFLKNSDKI
jgi:hypothetical protein